MSNRANFVAQPLRDSLSLPKTLTYEDIDQSFKAWVENDLAITFEGERVPTYAMFSIQRFGEYMQTWKGTDNDGNILINFKIITRETNPQPGTLYGGAKNIAGDPYFLMRRVLTTDKNGRPYLLEYRRKQPMCVDLSYTVSIVTNKITLLNSFNEVINDKFKSIQAYIFPNGYALPMTLDDVTDESDYQIDGRQYLSQSFNITVMGYTVKESDFLVEEVPVPQILSFGDAKKNSAVVEIETFGPCGDTPYYYQPVTLTTVFQPDEKEVKFRINTHFKVESWECNNIRDSFYVRVNDTPVDKEFEAKDGDQIFIYGIKKIDLRTEGSIVFKGYNPDVIYDERDNNEEIPSDNKQPDISVVVGEE